jgi:GNAT superfamily N-acetyltransferase
VVVQSYGAHLFVEVLERFELVVADKGGRLVGVAQLDPADGRLRALFVDDACQGRGIGGLLLAELEARAIRRGLPRIHGAMSLNAVAFYTTHGFRRCAGPAQLNSRVPVPVVPMEKPLAAGPAASAPPSAQVG